MRPIINHGAVILAATIMAVTAQAQELPIGPQMPIIPANVGAGGLADEAVLIEITCLEARWRSGPLLARLEALDELMTEASKKIKALEVNFEFPIYTETINAVKARLDNICGASSLSEQQGLIDSYLAYGQDLAKTIPTELENKLKTELEPKLKKAGEDLRMKFEAEFKAKGEELQKKAEAELKALSEKDIADKKAEITAQIEAEIANRLGARIEQGEFGTPPEQGRIEAEAKKMASDQVEAKKKEIEEAMKTKYEILAKNKEAAVRAELDKEAKKIEKEKTDAFLALAADFTNLAQKIETLAVGKEKDWLIYKEQAKSKKGALIDQAITAQTDEAVKTIEAERENLALAIANGEKLKNADDLIKDLKQAAAELAAALKSGELTPDQIAQAKDDFRQTWQTIKQTMEKVKADSPEKIIKKITSELTRSKVTTEIDAYLDWSRNSLGSSQRFQMVCAEPKKKFPNTVPAEERCRVCYKFSQSNQSTADFIRQITPRLEQAKTVFNEAFSAASNPNLTLEQALAIKSKVDAAALDLKAAKQEYENWSAKDKELVRQTEEYCRANSYQYIK